jgi:hypothetical protein
MVVAEQASYAGLNYSRKKKLKKGKYGFWFIPKLHSFHNVKCEF